MNRPLRPLPLVVATLLATGSPTLAADGALDAGFGTGGLWWDSTSTIPASDRDVLGGAAGPDGRAVVVGRRDFNQDGNYGQWFWQTFSATTNAGSCLLAAPEESVLDAALAFDSQGRLVLFGVYLDAAGDETLFVARYLYPACDLDETFGTGDGTLVSFTEPFLRVRAAAFDAGDRAHLAGNVGSGNAAIVRLTAAGLRDNSFGGDGILDDHLDALSSSTAVWRGLLILPGGDLIVAGSALTMGGNGNQAVVARYSATGQPVASFSGDGYLAFSFNPSVPSVVDGAYGIARDPRTKRIYLGGATEDGTTPRGGVAALTESGSLDSGFSANGLLFAATRSSFSAIAVDGLGRVVAAGRSESSMSPDQRFYAKRYTTGGALDTQFGPTSNGTVTADFDQVTDGVDDGRALELLPGAIVLLGNVERSSRIVVGAARLELALLFADGFESGDRSAW